MKRPNYLEVTLLYYEILGIFIDKSKIYHIRCYIYIYLYYEHSSPIYMHIDIYRQLILYVFMNNIFSNG